MIRRNLLGLVGREVAGEDMNLVALGWLATMSVRNATNSAEVWGVAVLPNTSPVLVLKAAYNGNPPEKAKNKKIEFSKKEVLREEVEIYRQPNHGRPKAR